MKAIAIIIFPIVLIIEFLLTTFTCLLYESFVEQVLNEELFTKQLLNYIRK